MQTAIDVDNGFPFARQSVGLRVAQATRERELARDVFIVVKLGQVLGEDMTAILKSTPAVVLPMLKSFMRSEPLAAASKYWMDWS